MKTLINCMKTLNLPICLLKPRKENYAKLRKNKKNRISLKIKILGVFCRKLHSNRILQCLL